MKRWYCETTIAINNFHKILQSRLLTGFWIWLGLWFWIYQGSEYAEFTRDSHYAWVCLSNFWMCLNMPKYALMCPNPPEWLLYYFPIVIPCLLERVLTYFNIYTLTRSCSQRDYEAIFLKRQNMIFSIVAGSIWFAFCFRLNIFTRFHITFFNYVPT